MCFSTNVLMASMGFHHDFLSSLCSPHSTTFFFLPSPHYLLSALLTVLPKSPGRPWQLFTALMGHWEREAHVEEEKEAPWAKQHAGHTAGNTISKFTRVSSTCLTQPFRPAHQQWIQTVTHFSIVMEFSLLVCTTEKICLWHWSILRACFTAPACSYRKWTI